MKQTVLFGYMIACATADANNVLLFESFNYTNGLIVNEFTYWNPGNPAAHKSSIWELTSGSMYCASGAGWTGVPDNIGPDANSSNGNNSAVFRLTTIRSNFADVTVSFGLLHQGLVSTSSTPPVDWDGIHIFLRYQSEANLYYASINRRDNKVVIKKKVPGGPNPSNGGTYYDISSYLPYTVPSNVWQRVTVTVQNNQNTSVSINLYSGSTLLVSAIDDGSIGGPPILNAGKVGIRGDNANVKFENFKVMALSSSAPFGTTAAVTNLSLPSVGQSSFRVEWAMSMDSSNHFFYAELYTLSATAAFLPARLEAFGPVAGQKLRAQISGLQSNTKYNIFVFHSKNLSTWSLPSNVAAVQTGN